MSDSKIFFFKDYLIKKYGQPLHRIPIDLPLSCPNRVNNSGQGCIFCAEDGARARHLRHNLDLPAQVAAGIKYAQRRYDAKPPYIAYFQSFTNTFADVDLLRKYYSEVLAQADFKMVIVATRPDCLGEEVLNYLEELNQTYDVWVELGVQTSNVKTLELINRGHNFDVVKTAAINLAARGIKCAAHVILGLPYEQMQDFIQTAKDIAALPFSGIKLHNLLVLKKTPLAKLYADKKGESGVFNIMNEYEYAEAVAEFLKQIPSEWPAMRMTADAPGEKVIAPKWWMSKGQFLEYLQEFLAESGDSSRFAGAVPKVKTNDGSYTFYHPKYKQHFHTLAGAESEAQNKFITPSQLAERLKQGHINLLDVGFGLGYNAIAAIKCAQECNGSLNVTTLELDEKTLYAGLAIFPKNSIEHKIIESLLKTGSWKQDNIEIKLVLGDARQSAMQLKSQLDVIFLDGFSPDKNPELWTYDFIKHLSKLLKKDGMMVTYTSAYPVLGALMRCGLSVGASEAFGRKRGGTAAAWEQAKIITPLPDKERGIVLKSTAGVPYRDIGLSNSTKAIKQYRDKVISKLRARGIPRWYKG